MYKSKQHTPIFTCYLALITYTTLKDPYFAVRLNSICSEISSYDQRCYELVVW